MIYYIDERNGKTKASSYLRIQMGDTEFQIEKEGDSLLITKINFGDGNSISITPHVSNQIKIK